jgi:hypothetical protein
MSHWSINRRHHNSLARRQDDPLDNTPPIATVIIPVDDPKKPIKTPINDPTESEHRISLQRVLVLTSFTLAVLPTVSIPPLLPTTLVTTTTPIAIPTSSITTTSSSSSLTTSSPLVEPSITTVRCPFKPFRSCCLTSVLAASATIDFHDLTNVVFTFTGIIGKFRSFLQRSTLWWAQYRCSGRWCCWWSSCSRICRVHIHLLFGEPRINR